MLPNKSESSPVTHVAPASSSASPSELLGAAEPALWQSQSRDFHEQLVAQRGEGWQAFWGSQQSQAVRYQVLLSQLPLDGTTVLEVGCGFGDFLDYATALGVRPARYLGVDLSAKLVAAAQARQAQRAASVPAVRATEVQFAVLDVLQAEPPLVPDFVIASGIMAVDFPGYEDYVLAVLRRFYTLGTRGFGLNFLSTCSEHPDGQSKYVEPAWLLSLFQTHLHWRCRLLHDYRPNDFTLIHVKG